MGLNQYTSVQNPYSENSEKLTPAVPWSVEDVLLSQPDSLGDDVLRRGPLPYAVKAFSRGHQNEKPGLAIKAYEI